MKSLLSVILSLHLIISSSAFANVCDPEKTKITDGGGMAKQLLSTSTAVVGSSALFSCKFGALLMSIKIYSAGSVVYVASELLGGKDHNDELKKNDEEIQKLKEQAIKGGEVQKAAIESMLKDEKRNLKFINKKKMWSNAIMAIYTAATIAALLEVIKMPLPFALPPKQMAACEPGSAMVKSALMKKALIGAFTYTAAGEAGIMKYAAALGMVLTPLPGIITTGLNFAPGRVAFFGASAIMAKSVGGDMNKKAEKTKNKIECLESMLAGFNKDTAVTTTIAEDSSSSSNSANSSSSGSATVSDGSGKNYALASLPDDPSRVKTCVSSTSEGFDVSGSACASPVKFVQPQFDASLTVPTLATASTLATDLGNAIAVGDSAKAEALAGSLGSMAGRLSEVKKSVEKQVNDALVARGEKAVDFEKSASDQVSSIQASVDKSLASGGSSLAALDGDAKLDPAAATEGNGEIKNIVGASSGESLALPAPAVPSITEGDLSGVETQTIEPQQTATLEEGLSNYESPVNDINRDSEVSLFKQVSNRYILNYTKIFDRKEPAQKVP